MWFSPVQSIRLSMLRKRNWEATILCRIFSVHRRSAKVFGKCIDAMPAVATKFTRKAHTWKLINVRIQVSLCDRCDVLRAKTTWLNGWCVSLGGLFCDLTRRVTDCNKLIQLMCYRNKTVKSGHLWQSISFTQNLCSKLRLMIVWK